MLNVRRLKQDFPPAILKDGRGLYDNGMVLSAKIVSISGDTLRLHCQVQGNFEKCYECEIEIDRTHSSIIDSDCNCPSKFDCSHLASVLFYLEEHIDALLVDYSKEANLDSEPHIDEEEKQQLRETIKEAESKEHVKKSKKHVKELLQEYIDAAKSLAKSPFFAPETNLVEDKAELAIIITPPNPKAIAGGASIEIQLALRLPFRSKPLYIPNARLFLEAVRYNEQLFLGSKRYYLTLNSFDNQSQELLRVSWTRRVSPKSKRTRTPGWRSSAPRPSAS